MIKEEMEVPTGIGGEGWIRLPQGAPNLTEPSDNEEYGLKRKCAPTTLF